MEQKILLLGNPSLYQVASPVTEDDMKNLPQIVQDLHDTLMAFRKNMVLDVPLQPLKSGYKNEFCICT